MEVKVEVKMDNTIAHLSSTKCLTSRLTPFNNFPFNSLVI